MQWQTCYGEHEMERNRKKRTHWPSKCILECLYCYFKYNQQLFLPPLACSLPFSPLLWTVHAKGLFFLLLLLHASWLPLKSYPRGVGMLLPPLNAILKGHIFICVNYLGREKDEGKLHISRTETCFWDLKYKWVFLSNSHVVCLEERGAKATWR